MQENKKNIAVVVPSQNSPTETFISNHIKYIPHNITVISGSPYPFQNGTQQPNFFTTLKLRIQGKISNTNWYSLYTRNEFCRIIEKNKIDLVFAEFLTTGAAIVEECRKKDVPLIVTALGYDISIKSIIESNRKSYKELLDYCKNVIIVSEHMKKELLELGCKESKIIYSPAGPDNSFFNISPKFDNQNIVALGRFVNKKAPHLLILAFRKVVDQIPTAKLILGGDGLLKNVVTDLIKVLNLEDNVKTIGIINQTQQKEIFENSYLFVQHSKVALDGDSEGTPVAILEASAAGLPIVSTKHAGIPSVVKNGETGLLSDEYDLDEMASNIIFLLKNNNIALKMGLEGKKYVKANFSLEKHIGIINQAIIS